MNSDPAPAMPATPPALPAPAAPAASALRNPRRSVAGWIHAHPWETAAAAIIVLGAVLRIVRYVANRSLWIDEAFLASSIVNRDFAGLFRPLDYEQSAPVGFLVLAKLCVTLFGRSEWALRLPSLVAGIALMPLTAGLGWRWLPKGAAVLAVAFISLSEPLIYFSVEAKQYALEAAVAAGLLTLAAVYESRRDGWATAELASFGALAVFFAHSAVFVLAAIVASRLIRDAARARAFESISTIIVGSLWAAAFLVAYFVFIKTKADAEAEWDAWTAGYAPWPVSLSAWIWYPNQLQYVLDTTLYVGALALAGVLCVFGLVQWAADRRWMALGTVALLAAAVMAASVLRKYPVVGRMAIFLAPALALALASGIAFLCGAPRSLQLGQATPTTGDNRGGRHVGRWPWRGTITAIVLLVPLLFGPITTGAHYAAHPPGREEVRDALRYIHAHARPTDYLYLGWSSKPAYDFYVPAIVPLRLPAEVGPNPQFQLVHCLEDLEAWSIQTRMKNGFQPIRVWVLLSFQTLPSSEAAADVHGPDKRRLDRVRLPGAWLDLWVFD